MTVSASMADGKAGYAASVPTTTYLEGWDAANDGHFALSPPPPKHYIIFAHLYSYYKAQLEGLIICFTSSKNHTNNDRWVIKEVECV